MMYSFSDKTPPSFDKWTDDYEKWVRKFRLWMAITEVEPRKRGALLLLHLDYDTQDRVMDLMAEEDIDKDESVDVILEHLKTFFGLDESVSTFELYKQFESLKRPIDMTISEYCDQFDRIFKKLQAKGTQLPESVLVLKLLKSSNLSEFEERLVRATVEEQKYSNMTEQLKKVFPVGVSSKEAVGDINSLHINDEPRELKEILYYNGNRYSREDSFCYKSGSVNYTEGKHKTRSTRYRRVTNNLGVHLDVRRCLVCDSVMHLKKDCPHRSDEESSINQEGGLEESDHIQYSDDGCCTYEIVTIETHHTGHPCDLKIGENITHRKATMDAGNIYG